MLRARAIQSLVLPVCLLTVATTSAASLAAQLRPAEPAQPRQTVVGRVSMPDGSAATGAVVMTSAGGECVTGRDGTFALEVELALDDESLDVTAFLDQRKGSGSLVASTRFVPAALAGTTSAGELALTLSPDCHPRWLSTFGGQAGTDDVSLPSLVDDLAVFDDGHGPALYVGGFLTIAGGTAANHVARWDGASWKALGTGTGGTTPEVDALAVFDDGDGPALYAGGYFTTAGGVSANRIARWDGTSWSALGSGMDSTVGALAVFDDGGGPALYAGGAFTTAGGVSANRIARWDGTTWAALGSGMDSSVWALTAFDDGGGAALYAAGAFSTAGGSPASGIARWDGSSWSALGSGLVGGGVVALAVHDDGGGPALYAGGNFTHAGGWPASSIARWNGASWSALGSGMAGGTAWVSALAVFDDGGGPALFAGGSFTSAGGVAATRMARWDGASWSGLDGGGTSGGVGALSVYDDGGGAKLYSGGAFTTAGTLEVDNVAAWDGSGWEELGNGLDDVVRALAVHDDGGGTALYVGGSFTTAGGSEVNHVARWNGSSWSDVDGGVGGAGSIPVDALAVFDDGSGPALYAGGDFSSAGGVAAENVARWDGSSWTPLASGVSSIVHALAVHDDGSGPALYAGGRFTSAGGVAANRIARWDGSSWSAVGGGFGPNMVLDLIVFDDGGGPALYAAGDFLLADDLTVNRIARWDGSSWSALGGGLGARASCLAVHDDGSGPALYAGGVFGTASGVAAKRIARWDGSTWSDVGGGFTTNEVEALTVFDDGSGPALFAGGGFSGRLKKWDGAQWTTLGAGLGAATTVAVLHEYDDGNGPALCVGGSFRSSPAGDSYLARWGCRPKATIRERKL